MDCARNIITANFSGGGTSATTAPLWQWDYGQVLCITGIEDLPAAFEVHFSTNRTGGVSTVAVGADGQVTIPNVLLTIGKNLNAWIYLSDSEGDGETEYAITIPVKARPMPETYDAEATGVFDDVVRQVSEYAQTAQTAADNAGASATAAAASADNAAASASAAETAKTAAETAQGKAEDAQAAAETAAQTATQKAQQSAQSAEQAASDAGRAESAAQRAETAQTGAEAAKTAAETAAQNAAASASAASASSTSAGQAASAAAQSASAAAQSAASIEGDVQTATQKASEATTAAGQAVTAKDAAVTAQTAAETAATNAGQSASTATTKAAEAAQSASGAAQSKTDAEAAATRAEQAAATLTVDNTLSDTSTNPVQNKVITGEVTQLKSHLSEVQRTLYSDLLKGKGITERWYIDPSTGTGSVNSIYFSIQSVEIPSGIERLYPYSNNGNNTYYIRSVVFFDSNGTYISGVSGDASTVEIGIPVPTNATTASVSINNASTEYYLSTIKDNVPYYDAKIDLLNSSVDLIETQIEEASDIVTVTHTDILHGKEVTPRWFIAPATGDGATNSAFFSVQNAEIPSGVTRLYPYSNNGNDTYYIRSVVFFDANGTYISGVSGNASYVAQGIPVPTNAVTASVSITNSSTEYYLSSVVGGDVEKKFLNEEINVSINQVTDLNSRLETLGIVPVQLENRKPTFTFIFDDGTDGDVNTKALFDSYGFKCGFALIGNTSYLAPRKERYLAYQDEGFEILSHSVNGTAFNTVTDLATADGYLKDSVNALRNAGFDVTGWVTPSTWILAEQLPLVGKYYQYGFGHLTGAPTGVAYHQFIGLDIRQLDRWSLQSNTVEATLAKIDEAVTNNAYMIFYGHSYPSASDNMTEENMNTILTYLKTKSDNGEIMVDTPRNTINNYYSFRHSDLLDLYNRLNT